MSFQSNIRSNSSKWCWTFQPEGLFNCRVQADRDSSWQRLWVQTSCLILKYCYVYCSEMTMLFIWNVAMSLYQIMMLHSTSQAWASCFFLGKEQHTEVLCHAQLLQAIGFAEHEIVFLSNISEPFARTLSSWWQVTNQTFSIGMRSQQLNRRQQSRPPVGLYKVFKGFDHFENWSAYRHSIYTDRCTAISSMALVVYCAICLHRVEVIALLLPPLTSMHSQSNSTHPWGPRQRCYQGYHPVAGVHILGNDSPGLGSDCSCTMQFRVQRIA